MVICFLFLSHIQHCILHIAKQASCILHNNALVLRDGDLFLTHLLFSLQGEGSWVDPLWETFLKQRKYSKQGIIVFLLHLTLALGLICCLLLRMLKFAEWTLFSEFSLRKNGCLAEPLLTLGLYFGAFSQEQQHACLSINPVLRY